MYVHRTKHDPDVKKQSGLDSFVELIRSGSCVGLIEMFEWGHTSCEYNRPRGQFLATFSQKYEGRGLRNRLACTKHEDYEHTYYVKTRTSVSIDEMMKKNRWAGRRDHYGQSKSSVVRRSKNVHCDILQKSRCVL
jgi:hypothetical protein